jgi:hypothetical protein
VDTTDSDAVARLLQCSGRWATDLTEKAREAAKATEIIRLKDEGNSNCAAARQVGADEGTVRNISAEKGRLPKFRRTFLLPSSPSERTNTEADRATHSGNKGRR